MSYHCTQCGKIHDERPALGFLSPDYYQYLSEEDKKNIATLAEDFCIIEYDKQTDRFIRAILSMPIKGTDDTLEYGVWVSLSEKNFLHYMDNFEENLEGETFFGYLCNNVPGYKETLHIRTNVVCGPQGERPHVFPHNDQADHPFVRDFIEGIPVEEADKRVHMVMKHM